MKRVNKNIIIQVKVGGVWGGVCDDGFTMKEANVVCKQLGFILGAQQVKTCHVQH